MWNKAWINEALPKNRTIFVLVLVPLLTTQQEVKEKSESKEENSETNSGLLNMVLNNFIPHESAHLQLFALA